MSKSSRQELENLSKSVVSFYETEKYDAGLQVLKPLLNSKCPFAKLDFLGQSIGQAGAYQPKKYFEAFDLIINYNAMGSFVIVGQALSSFLTNDFEGTMLKSREYIIKGDAWYVCDIIGERSLGQALTKHFEKTLSHLSTFLADDNKWVRRSAGVAIHFFAKRIRDSPEKAQMLLKLIEPYIQEKQVDIVKGIGWGLKTLGRYYSDLLEVFLEEQIKSKKKISKLMMRKALTYISSEKKRRIVSYVQSIPS